MANFSKLKIHEQKEIINGLIFDGLTYQEIEQKYSISVAEIADLINDRAVQPYNDVYTQQDKKEANEHKNTVLIWCGKFSGITAVCYVLLVFVQSALGGFESQIITDSLAYITQPLALMVRLGLAVTSLVVVLHIFFPILTVFINDKVNTIRLKKVFLDADGKTQLEFLAKIILAISLLVGLTFSAKAQDSDKRACIIQTASKEIGVLEVGGNNKGKRIDYYRSVAVGKNIKGYADAWCGYFVGYVFNVCSVTHNVAFTPRARDWFTNPKYIVWQKNRQYSVIKKPPKSGAVIGYKFKAGNIGHVEILVEWHEDYFISIGGNTSNKNTVYRDSNTLDGVRLKKRSIETAYVISDYIN